MYITEKQKQRMARQLKRSFELLNTTMKLKLAYLKKINPGKTENELTHQIYIETINAKERQWNLEKT